MNLISSARRPFRLLVLLGILLWSTGTTAIAQQPATNGNNSGAAVVTSSKSYVKEGIIFAILAGAAIFSVCRSSPRGL
ncbi:MAG: hypothetical protein HUJ26_02385 [Planctomycetaceae bacterium]|nr:hypothetical protein [Planctomycetaceae bacterium]